MNDKFSDKFKLDKLGQKTPLQVFVIQNTKIFEKYI